MLRFYRQLLWKTHPCGLSLRRQASSIPEPPAYVEAMKVTHLYISLLPLCEMTDLCTARNPWKVQRSFGIKLRKTLIGLNLQRPYWIHQTRHFTAGLRFVRGFAE